MIDKYEMAQDSGLLKTATNTKNPDSTNDGIYPSSTYNNKESANDDLYDSNQTKEDSNNDSNTYDVSDTYDESGYSISEE